MITALFCLLIFLIPSNLFLSLAKDTAYVRGLRVDYLLPKIYASDLAVLGMIALLSYRSWEQIKKNSTTNSTTEAPLLTLVIGALLLTLISVRQLTSPAPLASWWYLIKICEMVALAFLVIKHRSVIDRRAVTAAVIVTLLFQSILGIAQFQHQNSIFPSYLFLGETRLSSPAGIEHAQLLGSDHILPYGTTAHSNILGGTISLMLLWLMSSLKMTKKPSVVVLYLAVVTLSLITLWLTQSWSAWLSLGVGGIFLGLRMFGKIDGLKNRLRVFTPICLALIVGVHFLTPPIISVLSRYFPQNQSIVRRQVLNSAAWQMFLAHPIEGVGLNNFTPQVENYTALPGVVRFLQPAHHLGLLWLAETGMLGLLLAVVLIKLLAKKLGWSSNSELIILCLALLPIASLDHYMLTQQTGLLLVVLTAFFFDQNQKREEI